MKKIGTSEAGNPLVEIETGDKDVIGRMIAFLADLPIGLAGTAIPQTVAAPAVVKGPSAGCRVCVVCGEPLPKDAPLKKVMCSKRCSNAKYKAAHRAAPKSVRICPTCKKQFTPWRKDQRFCSGCAKKSPAPGVPHIDKEDRLEAIRAAARRIKIPPEATDRGDVDENDSDQGY